MFQKVNCKYRVPFKGPENQHNMALEVSNLKNAHFTNRNVS